MMNSVLYLMILQYIQMNLSPNSRVSINVWCECARYVIRRINSSTEFTLKNDFMYPWILRVLNKNFLLYSYKYLHYYLKLSKCTHRIESSIRNKILTKILCDKLLIRQNLYKKGCAKITPKDLMKSFIVWFIYIRRNIKVINWIKYSTTFTCFFIPTTMMFSCSKNAPN